MSNLKKISKKIYSLNDLKIQLQNWRDSGDSIVFTNGCFDILHQGHIEVLAKTADLGNRLIIGLNSDSSVKLLKGKNRPINTERARALLLAAIDFVDAIILFPEETPKQLIAQIQPNILAKGGDYKITEIVGHRTVTQNGGKVISIPLTEGFSSTLIIEKIQNG